MVIKKVVIPAAGLGTRLLPITKEIPKEMLPLFLEGKNGKASLKPLLQAIFEQLYDLEFREFCIVVGRGKRAIEEHFTPDWGFVEYLQSRNKAEVADDLREFYRKIGSSTIVFINQPDPRGFGDAVLKARVFTSDEEFLVHAGDDLILSKGKSYIRRLIKAFEQLKAHAVLLVERVEDPRRYGVVESEKISEEIYRVKTIVEKPGAPRSNMATIAVYVFNPTIYPEIEKVRPDQNREIQLTDAIQGLINRGHKVYAIELKDGERIDIGTLDTYWKALNRAYKSWSVI